MCNSFQKFQVVDGLQAWSRKDGLQYVFDGKERQFIDNSINTYIDSFTLLKLVIFEFYKRK